MDAKFTLKVGENESSIESDDQDFQNLEMELDDGRGNVISAKWSWVILE